MLIRYLPQREWKTGKPWMPTFKRWQHSQVNCAQNSERAIGDGLSDCCMILASIQRHFKNICGRQWTWMPEKKVAAPAE